MPVHTIADEVKRWAHDAIERFNASVIRDPASAYVARYRRQYLYLDRLSFGSVTRVARLAYTGNLKAWDFAIYKYSSETYDADDWLFPGSQFLDGTIEGAMRAGLEAYP